jgi:hypothetical protein
MLTSRSTLVILVALGACSGPRGAGPDRAASRVAAPVRASGTTICAAHGGCEWRGLPEGIDPPALPGTDCIPAGGGAWTFEARVDSYAPANEEEDAIFEGSLFAVFRSERASSPPRRIAQLGIGTLLSTHIQPVTFDYDGDGVAELVLRTEWRFHEGASWGSHLLHFDGAEIRDYGPSTEFADFITDVADVDGDGRPDIRSGRPFVFGRHEIDDGGAMYLGGPNALWHSLPDGTFTMRDALGRRALRDACTARESLFGDYEDLGYEVRDTLFPRIACRMIEGDARAQVERAIRAEYPMDACRRERAATDCAEELDDLLAHAEHCERALRGE